MNEANLSHRNSRDIHGEVGLGMRFSDSSAPSCHAAINNTTPLLLLLKSVSSAETRTAESAERFREISIWNTRGRTVVFV
ncbi:unnamed protein product [Linum trigynum]|uniref:Uncharacterized protein n=1 Tax=Linum trigynum TaxID=586398 RepID=A0AAV2EGP5_9ROSI